MKKELKTKLNNIFILLEELQELTNDKHDLNTKWLNEAIEILEEQYWEVEDWNE